MSQPRNYKALWRYGYQLTWPEGQTDSLCFRCRLMPMPEGYWPLLDLLFLAWCPVLSLLLLQVHKINSLFKVAKKASVIKAFSWHFIQLLSICLFACLFNFPFWFTALDPNPCFSSWLEQNRRLIHRFLAAANKGRDCSAFLTALLLSLLSLFLKAQSLSHRIVYDPTEDFINRAATV